MSTLVVVGAQWGDEGKGKVVDVLAGQADIVARFSGGSNAGHTLVIGDKQVVTHLVPSGCAYPGTPCVLGAGMVIDPELLKREVADLQRHGFLVGGELRVSLDAHVVFEHHRRLDDLREGQRWSIGTTRRGVGPAYEAKAARRGVRVRDLFDAPTLRRRLEHNKEVVDGELERLGWPDERVDLDVQLERAREWASWLEPMVCDTGLLLYQAVRAGRRLLVEGAQGTMLDLDHGSYPYVTSCSTVAGGACSGLGLGPTHIDRVWGITKAYATRVGDGPLPTRVADDRRHELLRDAGMEYGATTGRPRTCGWLDLPALRYAARLNGLTGLCVTKLDVLARVPEAMLCVSYADGAEPGADPLDRVAPRLEPLPGWGDPELAARVRAARSWDGLPGPARAYLERVAAEVEVPIVLVSVGASRHETFMVAEAF